MELFKSKIPFEQVLQEEQELRDILNSNTKKSDVILDVQNLKMFFKYANTGAYKYNKAVAVDPSLANDVAKRRSRLKFPDGAVVFQKGYSKGQTYRVGGWIGETTTIR